MYLNVPNPHVPHVNPGQHAGSDRDCQPQGTRMHLMWTFVGKCRIIYLISMMVLVVVIYVHLCACAFILCMCVSSSVKMP